MSELETTPNLIVSHSDETHKIYLTNIGKYPILIKESRLYPLIEDEIERVLIAPLDSIELEIPISSHYPQLVEGEFPEQYNLSIEMYYAGKLGNIWCQSFRLWREEVYHGHTMWLMSPESLHESEDNLLFDLDKLGT